MVRGGRSGCAAVVHLKPQSHRLVVSTNMNLLILDHFHSEKRSKIEEAPRAGPEPS